MPPLLSLSLSLCRASARSLTSGSTAGRSWQRLCAACEGVTSRFLGDLLLAKRASPATVELSSALSTLFPKGGQSLALSKRATHSFWAFSRASLFLQLKGGPSSDSVPLPVSILCLDRLLDATLYSLRRSPNRLCPSTPSSNARMIAEDLTRTDVWVQRLGDGSAFCESEHKTKQDTGTGSCLKALKYTLTSSAQASDIRSEGHLDHSDIRTRRLASNSALEISLWARKAPESILNPKLPGPGFYFFWNLWPRCPQTPARAVGCCMLDLSNLHSQCLLQNHAPRPRTTWDAGSRLTMPPTLSFQLLCFPGNAKVEGCCC